MTRPRLVPDEGSLTVELVVLTPVLFAMALMILIFGRVSESHQQVDSAAAAGAEAAAVLPDPTSAQTGASIEAAIDVSGQADTCLGSQVSTDVSHFYPGGYVGVDQGGYVTVTVRCQVGLADISVLGMPTSVVAQASATAPIDPYRSAG
jgi:Flp pilus assembly protein TadG